MLVEDYTVSVGEELEGDIDGFLRDVCGAIVSKARETVRVRSGDTQVNYKFEITGNDGTVFNLSENAFYEEYGTGKYADPETGVQGRQTPWVYYDEVLGSFFMTEGKAPTRPMRTAIDEVSHNMNSIIEKHFGGGKG